LARWRWCLKTPQRRRQASVQAGARLDRWPDETSKEGEHGPKLANAEARNTSVVTGTGAEVEAGAGVGSLGEGGGGGEATCRKEVSNRGAIRVTKGVDRLTRAVGSIGSASGRGERALADVPACSAKVRKVLDYGDERQQDYLGIWRWHASERDGRHWFVSVRGGGGCRWATRRRRRRRQPSSATSLPRRGSCLLGPLRPGPGLPNLRGEPGAEQRRRRVSPSAKDWLIDRRRVLDGLAEGADLWYIFRTLHEQRYVRQLWLRCNDREIIGEGVTSSIGAS
jgi:hypothetical protein